MFEPWVATKPSNVVVERIPVNFGHDSWELLQKAYATLRTMEVQDKLSLELFKAVQENNFWLGDDKSVAAWLAMHDIDLNETKKAYNSKFAKDLLKAYYASELKYNVRSIPRLIVNGIYEVNIKNIPGEDELAKEKNLAELIEFLLAKQA